MANDIFLSIIIPTFNRHEFIGDTVEKLLEQKGSNYEIIIVDDCSTDETERVCGLLVGANEKVKYFKNGVNSKNGLLNWKNAVQNYAKGDWVVICSDDDFFAEDDSVEKILRFIDLNQDADVVFLNGANCYRLNCQIVGRKYTDSDNKLDGLNFLEANSDFESVFCVKKEFMEKHDYLLPNATSFNGFIFTDLALCYGNTYFLEDVTYCFRVGAHNINKHKTNIDDLLSAFYAYMKGTYQHFKNFADDEKIRKIYHGRFLYFLNTTMFTSDDICQTSERLFERIFNCIKGGIFNDACFGAVALEAASTFKLNIQSNIKLYNERVGVNDAAYGELERKKNIAIYGLSIMGMQLCQYFLDNGFNIVCVIEDDVTLWREDIKCVSYAEAKDYIDGIDFIIIATLKLHFIRTMIDNLQKIGFDNSKILTVH
jgi:glycosyltransferase involved in cell wall biosynthesis